MGREEVITKRQLQLLKALYADSKKVTVNRAPIDKGGLAKQLHLSRRTLNYHIGRLQRQGCLMAGRSFIDITEEGLKGLGVRVSPSFVLIKVSPLERGVYERMAQLPAQGVFRLVGDMDALLIVEQERLEETIEGLTALEGVQGIKSYLTIQTIK